MKTLKFQQTENIEITVPFGIVIRTGRLWIGVGLRFGAGDEQSLSIAEARRLAQALNAAADRASKTDRRKARAQALGFEK